MEGDVSEEKAPDRDSRAVCLHVAEDEDAEDRFDRFAGGHCSRAVFEKTLGWTVEYKGVCVTRSRDVKPAKPQNTSEFLPTILFASCVPLHLHLFSQTEA